MDLAPPPEPERLGDSDGRSLPSGDEEPVAEGDGGSVGEEVFIDRTVFKSPERTGSDEDEYEDYDLVDLITRRPLYGPEYIFFIPSAFDVRSSDPFVLNDIRHAEFASRTRVAADEISRKGLTQEVVIEQAQKLLNIKFSRDDRNEASHQFSSEICAFANHLLDSLDAPEIEERAETYCLTPRVQAVMEVLGSYLELCLKNVSNNPGYGERRADIRDFGTLLVEASKHRSPQGDPLEPAAKDCTYMIMQAALHHEMEGGSSYR